MESNDFWGIELRSRLLPMIELAIGSYGLDATVKLVMSKKDIVGEFSLDLYYNDIDGDNGLGYVVLLTFLLSGKKKHFRSNCFISALAECVLWLDVVYGTNLTGFALELGNVRLGDGK